MFLTSYWWACKTLNMYTRLPKKSNNALSTLNKRIVKSKSILCNLPTVNNKTPSPTSPPPHPPHKQSIASRTTIGIVRPPPIVRSDACHDEYFDYG